MTRHAIELANRREQLLAKAAMQRIALARDLAPWRVPLALADQGLSSLRYLRHHPSLLVGGIGLLTVVRARRPLKWLERGWLLWQVIHRLHVGLSGGGLKRR